MIIKTANVAIQIGKVYPKESIVSSSYLSHEQADGEFRRPNNIGNLINQHLSVTYNGSDFSLKLASSKDFFILKVK